MFAWYRRRRRAALRRRPVPAHWHDVLAAHVPYLAHLPEADRAELLGHVQVLLAEKRFYGCAGFQVDDTVRLTIAAQAALLLLHRDTDYFPLMRTVLVYPGPFVAPQQAVDESGLVEEYDETRSGESWYRGPVVLSWPDVLESAADPHDGYNVVLHEFAHQLDDEGGRAGLPALAPDHDPRDWAAAFGAAWAALQADVDAGRDTLLDPYAAQSPVEFFAVATEVFFERPRALRARHPELYRQLSAYYRQDPAAFVPA